MTSKAGDLHMERISKFVAGIVEARDPDLGEHHQRLGEGAVWFAQHIGRSAEELEMLSIGARIHDIGKLSISERVLNKPGRLTASEFSLVKQHAEIGTQLLAPLGLDTRINEIVYHHHENYDGSGYPGGLAGTAIPPLARIVRIWDSFDALTTDRPYHKGVACEEALRLLVYESHCYDPTWLESFCKMMRESVRGEQETVTSPAAVQHSPHE